LRRARRQTSPVTFEVDDVSGGRIMFGQNLALAATITGFGLGAGIIFSIGPQNLKLIQAGALRRHPAVVAGTGYLSEILIVGAGVSGVGSALQTAPSVQLAMQLAGIAFLLWCALRMFASNAPAAGWNAATAPIETRGQAVRSMLALTWLNPLVYVEVMLLVGVLSSGYGAGSRFSFALGFLAASCLRFFGLPACGRLLAPWLATGRAQTAFSRIAGGLLLLVAASQAATVM
jgi:L-lysine exporter family protein LysE/ArgO